jgi:(p)ppGpp synthase/HD superfamily hydrolase
LGLKDLKKAPTLEDAIALAAQAHAGQLDKGGHPYILHPLRVMLRLTREIDRIVAVLHDVVEDTYVTMEDLREAGYSEEILAALDSVTQRFGESWDVYLTRVEKNVIGLRVKLADIDDNMDLRRIAQPNRYDLERVEKYKVAVARLRERLNYTE